MNRRQRLNTQTSDITVANRWTDSVIYVAIILRKDMEHPQLIRIGRMELQQLTGTVLNKSVGSGMDELYGWPELDEDVAVYMGSHLLETFFGNHWKNGYQRRYSILHGNRHDASAEPGCRQLRGSGRRLLGQKHFHHLFIIVCSYPKPYGADNIHNIITFGGMQYDLSEQEWNQATSVFPQPGSFPGLSGSLKGSSHLDLSTRHLSGDPGHQ